MACAIAEREFICYGIWLEKRHKNPKWSTMLSSAHTQLEQNGSLASHSSVGCCRCNSSVKRSVKIKARERDTWEVVCCGGRLFKGEWVVCDRAGGGGVLVRHDERRRNSGL